MWCDVFIQDGPFTSDGCRSSFSQYAYNVTIINRGRECPLTGIPPLTGQPFRAATSSACTPLRL